MSFFIIDILNHCNRQLLLKIHIDDLSVFDEFQGNNAQFVS